MVTSGRLPFALALRTTLHWPAPGKRAGPNHNRDGGQRQANCGPHHQPPATQPTRRQRHSSPRPARGHHSASLLPTASSGVSGRRISRSRGAQSSCRPSEEPLSRRNTDPQGRCRARSLVASANERSASAPTRLVRWSRLRSTCAPPRIPGPQHRPREAVWCPPGQRRACHPPTPADDSRWVPD